MDMPLCACGCGQPVRLATQPNARLGIKPGQPNKYLFRHVNRLSGERHASWQGGKPLIVHGYRLIPVAPKTRVREHILIVERAMGKALRQGAPVHHVDGNKSNNANTNLVACHDAGYHQLLHVRQRALDATGDANKIRCRLCRQYDDAENLTILARGNSAGLAQHRACHTARERDRLQQSRSA